MFEQREQAQQVASARGHAALEEPCFHCIDGEADDCTAVWWFNTPPAAAESSGIAEYQDYSCDRSTSPVYFAREENRQNQGAVFARRLYALIYGKQIDG
ncbi:hypothetical protein AK812_SmicGene44243 [Symbiodinium microadriaticum]|uniref:Uncharacterized protein n=1 Tax=Symbiodinium microadriaticum TaxID=2951 RepID=A0A1Q9BZ03_SYMMI|nr:hypothetical protein AK812_SmicGene44243 [Symbiodinium microadriaticum]